MRNERIETSAGADVLLFGSAGNDWRLGVGGVDNDRLFGEQADHQILGAAGNSALSGDDHLVGECGDSYSNSNPAT